MRLTSEQEREIRELVAGGGRIAAVKRVREITGLGLKEALEAVNRLAFGQPGQDDPPSLRGRPHAHVRSPGPRPEAFKKAEAAAMAAISKGHVLEAVKQYRLHTGLGLKESKDQVDILSLVHRSQGRVSAKLAKLVIGKLATGHKEDAMTQLRAGAGFDDDEARKFIARMGRLGAARRGCGPGCVVVMAALLVLLIAVLGLILAQQG